VSQYSFDRFAVNTTDRMLRANGCDVAIGARAIELLIALLERHGSLLSKQDLLEKVWRSKNVGENNLSTQVGTLRRVLGLGAIITVPGMGYRFGLPVIERCGSARDVSASQEDVAIRPVTETPATWGDIEWCPEERRVKRAGVSLKLGPRAYDLLSVLLVERHRIVPKSELLRRAWPGLVVQEDNLFVQISKLRRALGDGAIATVPGRGYRFVARPGPGPRPAQPHSGSEAPHAMVPRYGAVPPVSNLSVQAGIVGRDDALAAMAGLMSRFRLITVVGPSGVGKTSLVREAARAWPGAHGTSVTWVDLSCISDGARVVGAVAQALGVPLASELGLSVPAACLELMNRIVVLDTAEHVSESVAELALTLLAGAPGIRLLITSQAALRLPGEQVYRLDGLALPHGPVSVEAALGHGAIALFAERARSADPRFELRAEHVETVVDICCRLDGLPLAIELAAARLALFGLRGLAQRIDERFQLLVGGSRRAPPRHRTLRAALDWSHGLLSAAEQRVFRRLGVFPGEFTLELAVRVAGDAADDEWAATEQLATLVDRGLVFSYGNQDIPRYGLQNTPRAYALVQLDRAGECHATLRRHAQAMAETGSALMGQSGLYADRSDRVAAVGRFVYRAEQHDRGA
jgi:predicted ATPase/DNA-binding winged helix-turn-helix (wHTH) protein